MNQRIIAAVSTVGLCLFASGAAALNLEQEGNRFSYSLGYNVGKGLSRDFPALNAEALKAGLEAGLGNGKAKLSEADMSTAVRAGQEKMVKARRAKVLEMAKVNLKAGQQFLADNAKKGGVVTTDSGLQYKVVKKGKGKSPKATDKVSVHYHGMLPGGEVFDSSVERGTPSSFPLNGVIKGWTEGLQLMKEGAKYTFYVPANLAYGEQPRGPKIGPNQVLVFDVELLEVLD